MDKMKEEEKKFFNKLYDDMLISGFITDTNVKDRDDKIKAVTSYLDKLQRVHTKAINSTRDSDLELLKSFYRKRYIIKEEDIPDSYYDLQAKIAFERGLGNITISEDMKKELATSVIADQRKSLDIWLDYLFSSDAAFYPYQLKYWAFQGMLKMGSYDKEKKEFTRRGKTTVNMFVDLNKEVLALTINEMNNYLKNQELSDENLAKMLANSSFNKLYTYFYNQVNLVKKDDTNSNEGIWVKYNQGSDHMPLVKSLEAMGTGWCTAGETTAKMQLELGDFYVYYTKDKNGEYKIPRVAIRMEENSIAEIRGVAKDQNIESNMEKVVEEKLEEFPDKDKYMKKVNDMKMMTTIYEKHKKGIDLSKEELTFLYEIYDDIVGFGFLKDPRIREVKSERNSKKDYCKIFSCKEDEITDNEEELYNRPNEIVCYIGDIKYKASVDFPKLCYISGNISSSKKLNFNGLNSLQVIGGDIKFKRLVKLEGLNNLRIIGGDADFERLEELEGLKNLKILGGSAYFPYLRTLEGLKNLQEIGGYADFPSLSTSEGLKNLRIIGGYADFDSLPTLEILNNLEKIGGSAYFGWRTTLEGLNNLYVIGGDAKFGRLTKLEGLNNLQVIGGDADFSSLPTLEGLNNLRGIGREANFGSLTRLEGLKNLQEIIYSADFSSLTRLEGLNNLEIIRQGANFKSLTTLEGLNNLQKIGWDADFSSLPRLEGLNNLQEIGHNANFSSLTRLEGLNNLQKIGYDANFSSLPRLEGLNNLQKIGRRANFSSLTRLEGLKNLQVIGYDANFSSLPRLEGLNNLQEIGCSADLSEWLWWGRMKGLKNLEEIIKQGANFKSLTTLEGLNNLQKIGFDANFSSLTRLEGLQNLTYVGGELYCPLISKEEINNKRR